jgi:methyl-accepting chemotaxis protein
MNILQRILKSNQKKAHPSVEELKTAIQQMEEDLRQLLVQLEENKENLAVPGQEGQPAPDGRERVAQTLKDTINELEVQLRVLRSRVMVSSATNTINHQMAQLSTLGSVTLLQNQKENAAAGLASPQAGDKTSSSPEADQAPGQP